MALNRNRADEAVRKAKMDQQALDITERLQHIRHKLLVMSGKGGVGKSSVATYLGVSLARRGYRVGIMDVDLHGPNIPRMLGIKGTLQPDGGPGKLKPYKYLPNLEVMSIEVLSGDKDAATIWRGPLKGGVIKQFIADIDWMELDFLVIDSPPGTGDEPLTVAQTIPEAKAVVVTTPQEVSLADVRKSINFCRNVNMEILGLVENMSGLSCPYCGRTIEVFRTQGGLRTAETEHLRLLGSLPLEPEVVRCGDTGSMNVLEKVTLGYSRAFGEMVDEIEDALGLEAASPSASRQERVSG